MKSAKVRASISGLAPGLAAACMSMRAACSSAVKGR